MSKDEILEQALALPVKDRAELAARLLRSLDDGYEQDLSPEEWEAAWAEEIRRRSEQYHAGQTAARDWDEALTDMRRRLEEGRRQ
jgi:putative addiction module component (TIGR02574 family)